MSSPVVTSSVISSLPIVVKTFSLPIVQPTGDSSSNVDQSPVIFGIIGGIAMALTLLVAVCITIACILKRRGKHAVNFQISQEIDVKGNDAYGRSPHSAIPLAENEAYRPVQLGEIDVTINQATYDYPEAPAGTNVPTAPNEAYGGVQHPDTAEEYDYPQL